MLKSIFISLLLIVSMSALSRTNKCLDVNNSKGWAVLYDSGDDARGAMVAIEHQPDIGNFFYTNRIDRYLDDNGDTIYVYDSKLEINAAPGNPLPQHLAMVNHSSQTGILWIMNSLDDRIKEIKLSCTLI